MQLSLFNIIDIKYEVSYWAYNFDKKGNYIKNYMSNFIEIKSKDKLDGFIDMLIIIDAINIKIKELIS